MNTAFAPFVRRTLAAVALASGIVGTAGTAVACGDGAYIGQICFVAFAYCPEGTLQANGQVLPVNQYQALYSLLGNTYGGTSSSTFALPDLRGRVVVGTNTPPANGLSPVALGQKRGQETVALSAANLPAHNHAATSLQASAPVSTATPTTTTPTLTNGQTAYLANADTGKGNNTLEGLYTTTAPATGAVANLAVTVSGATANTGGGAPVSTLPPELGLTACIVVTGLYPTRP
ncbi:MAG TPA: tail fiber protein [Azospirillum sp.]|nr:tail fiber protein [Azospirillum sp.]